LTSRITPDSVVASERRFTVSEFKVRIPQNIAKALYVLVQPMERAKRYGIDHACLRVGEKEARWEATNGHVLLMIEADVDIPVGTYLLGPMALMRVVRMPKYLFSSDDELVTVIDMERADVPEFPDTDQVLDVDTTPNLMPQAIQDRMIEKIHKISKALGSRGLNVGWDLGGAADLNPSVWERSGELRVQLLVMPSRHLKDKPTPWRLK